MFIIQVLYIITSFILICGATVIYNGNRRNSKHRTFALLFVFMAFWQQSALLISLLPNEKATYIFMYGLIPIMLGSFMLLLHAVYLITGVYLRKYSIIYKLLFMPPVLNVLLFPVDGWLYRGEVMVYSEHSLPGPGGFINFALMFVYFIVMVMLLLPKVWRHHRPSQVMMGGMASFILWSLFIVIFGELSGDWDTFSLVPFGINFWAAAVYISVSKYDSLPSFERRYNVLFNQAPVGILIIDNNGLIHEASPRVSQYLGKPINDLLGHTIFHWLEDEEQDRLSKIFRLSFKNRKVLQFEEISFRDNSGQLRYVSVSSNFMDLEGDAYQLLLINDITDTKERETQIHQLAFFDNLTSLHNRVSFHNVFEEWRNTHQKFALIILDLDGFKHINDYYGHLSGDEALKYFATQLKASVGSSDFVARLSGDEFVILLSEVKDIDNVVQVIRSRLDQPFKLSTGQNLTLYASIGVSLYPKDGGNMDELFKEADVRMYENKRQQQKK